MMNKFNVTLGMAMAAIMFTGVFASDDAMAHKRKYRHKHRSTHHRTVRHYQSADSGLSSKVEMLEAQLRATQDEVTALRSAGANTADSSKVQELDAWMQESKAKPQSPKYDNLLFFRGGYAKSDHSRSGVSIPNVGRGAGVVSPGDDEAFYIGAGFDFGLTDNVWGLMDDTEVLGELMFEWKDFGQSDGVGVSTDGANFGAPNLDGSVGVNATLTPKRVSVSQFTLSAAPKIKFLKGSKFRPWVIPIGLAFHIISPPSESITVFNPGMMFGAGADYNFWKSMYVGADARYHLTSRSGDAVNTDGFTAGGYIGLGF